MSETPRPAVLTIAGLDPGGGAGLLADVEAIRACGGDPRAVCAALTAQGREVIGSYAVDPSILEQQIHSVVPVAAVKTGMMPTEAAVERITFLVVHGELPAPVVDPVRHASSGMTLMDDLASDRLRQSLVPRAAAVTPNLDEAAWLADRDVNSVEQMEDAARALLDLGAGLAVITGGHLEDEQLVDVAMAAGDAEPWRIERRRVPGTARGTGCRFSAALATYLARGDAPRVAVERAGDHVASYVELARAR